MSSRARSTSFRAGSARELGDGGANVQPRASRPHRFLAEPALSEVERARNDTYNRPVPLIAIVDDEANIRETVAFALRREGYEVEMFGDGVEAWTALGEKIPDLVILDILMPRMDGLELCRKIRSVSETVPIIFLTSRD